tara:strand:- start:37 stop:696 length:660 start_codon:yes stop_codon:yes gene_type:complete
VALSLVPQQARKIAPPRVLSLPFILGRPFGSPEDASFQHRVLDAALALFTQTDSPIFSEFFEEAPEISESPEEWACPVSFNEEEERGLLANVKNEIALLKPWFEKRKTIFGRTSFGISDFDLDDLAPFIHTFLSDEQDSKPDSSKLKLATDDLNAFYLEAALQQPSASEISAFENWYWNETAAGELVKKVALHCQKSLDPGLQKTAKLLIVPERIISWN